MSRDDYIGVSNQEEEEQWEAKEQQQAQEEALECRGSIIDLYYIIEEKYRKQIKVSRRGRPKKLSI